MPIETGCTHCGSDQHNTTECPMRDAAPAGERESPPTMPEILYGPATHVTWTPDHTPKEQRRQVVLVDAEQFAAWQRTQSAGVPEGWCVMLERLADTVEQLNECVRDCIDEDMEDPDMEHELCDETDELVQEARAMLAAAPQPAPQPVMFHGCFAQGVEPDHFDAAGKCKAMQPAPQQGDEVQSLPYWEPCNPGCDPEFNGSRSRHCAELCHNARAALSTQSGVQRLREALEFACKSLAQMTSADGSGHADIALSVLRMAGVGSDERERLVEGWKSRCQWRIDSALSAQQGEGERT